MLTKRRFTARVNLSSYRRFVPFQTQPRREWPWHRCGDRRAVLRGLRDRQRLGRLQGLLQADATFSCQAEPLAEVRTLQGYADWMKGMLGILPDGRYELKS